MIEEQHLLIRQFLKDFVSEDDRFPSYKGHEITEYRVDLCRIDPTVICRL